MPYERELAAVQSWIDETDRIAMSHFAISVDTELKQDGTPVTAADRAVESYLRARIEEEFGGDAILGEETGESGGGTRRWIIDPIDATKNYARGIPVFATLVALEDDEGLALGFVSAPALGAHWWATRGGGAFRDGEPIHVSSVGRLEDAHVCTGGIDWAWESGVGEMLLAVSVRAARQRGFGDFWGHMLVAQGSQDAMLEFAPLSVWDIAAPKIIVEEAGGRVTTLDGENTLARGSYLSSNGVVHEEILEGLKG